MAEVLNADMGYTLEMVKQSPSGNIVGDEVYRMGTCSECQADVAVGWGHCPGCGERLDA